MGCLPFPSLHSKQFRSALGKKYSGLRSLSISCFQAGVKPTVNIYPQVYAQFFPQCWDPNKPYSLFMTQNNIIWANNIHQRGGGHERMY